MKRLLVLSWLVLFLLACSEPHPILGSWQGKDADGHEATMYFEPDGKFEGMAKGESIKGTWELNEELQPARVTLKFEDGAPFITIIKLQGDKMLIEPLPTEGTVPREFSEKATVYIRQR